MESEPLGSHHFRERDSSRRSLQKVWSTSAQADLIWKSIVGWLLSAM